MRYFMGIDGGGTKTLGVLTAMDGNRDFKALYGEVQRVLGRTLNTEELKLLEAKGFKYIPREFFGQELREAAE